MRHEAKHMTAAVGAGAAPPIPSAAANSQRIWSGIGLGTLLLTIVACAAYDDQVLRLRDQLHAMGVLGIAAFVLLEAAWTMTTLPSAPLMTMGGMLYGFWQGAVYALVGNLLGSLASFWLGRVVLRRRVQGWTHRYDSLRTALDLVESRPFLSVFASRVSSAFPLSLMSYALGVTRVSLKMYFAATLVSVLPGAVMYAGIGHGLWTGFGRPRGAIQVALLALVFVLGGGAWVVYRHLRRRRVKQAT
jgi:uncharacterized membrane protein YdjX (TVP38/TMEM64 family)